MKASIGRIVIFEGDVFSNGTRVHPSIVNRVWDDKTEVMDQNKVLVNVMVLPDCGMPVSRTSIPLFEDKAEADKYRGPSTMPVCYFPARV